MKYEIFILLNRFLNEFLKLSMQMAGGAEAQGAQAPRHRKAIDGVP